MLVADDGCPLVGDGGDQADGVAVDERATVCPVLSGVVVPVGFVRGFDEGNASVGGLNVEADDTGDLLVDVGGGHFVS